MAWFEDTMDDMQATVFNIPDLLTIITAELSLRDLRNLTSSHLYYPWTLAIFVLNGLLDGKLQVFRTRVAEKTGSQVLSFHTGINRISVSDKHIHLFFSVFLCLVVYQMLQLCMVLQQELIAASFEKNGAMALQIVYVFSRLPFHGDFTRWEHRCQWCCKMEGSLSHYRMLAPYDLSLCNTFLHWKATYYEDACRK